MRKMTRCVVKLYLLLMCYSNHDYGKAKRTPGTILVTKPVMSIPIGGLDYIDPGPDSMCTKSARFFHPRTWML